MKCVAGFLLLTASLTAAAAPDSVHDVGEWHRVEETNPERAAEAVRNGWMVLTLPAQAGTRSPCCWTGHWDENRDRGCILDDREHSFGNSDSAPLVRELRLFARVEEGSVDRLVLAGPDCPVDAAGQGLTAVDGTDPAMTRDWLVSLARQGEDRSHGALYALANFEGEEATGQLEMLAREPGEWPARNAVFWLGEARGQVGAQALDRLLDELPDGDIRRSVNFGLSQNDSPFALERLERVALSDRDAEQRADALFWLARSHPERARPILMDALDQVSSGNGLERVVFAASQLGDGTGDALLFEIAGDPGRPDRVRQQAFFWLANSDDPATVDRLVAMLSSR